MSNTVVLMRQRGTITLPSKIRSKYQFEEGTAFSVLDLDGVIMLVPKSSVVPKLVTEIERLREEAGVSLEELLAGLRKEREQYYEEKYGSAG
jgi:bifunctional DNA-binding transcriptional regulator/antitoxin component of YhaV-PrlF toxin-antitoxin module